VLRVVLDTNLVVSGSLWLGVPGKVLDAALDGLLVSVTSEAILAELNRVLSRDKFEPKFRERGLTARDIVSRFRLSSELIDPLPISSVPVRDPKDVMLVECAVSGKVDYLISGDKDLLEMTGFPAVRVITPSRFLEII
jgi:putative PIN family toxin of toxin-antitoxin system